MSRIEEAALEHAREVLSTWFDSGVGGQAHDSFMAGAKWLLERAKNAADDFGVNEPYALIEDLEALFAEQRKEAEPK